MLTADDPAWAMFLEGVRHDFHHLPAYTALEATRMGGQAMALHVDDGERSLLLPLVVRAIPGSRLDAVSPYGYPGPLTAGTDDPSFITAALTAAAPALREAGWVSLFVRMHPLLNADPPSGPGLVLHEGDTVAIDLSISSDDRWKVTRRQHRQKIVHAIDAGDRAWFDEDWQHFSTFQRLYEETMHRVSAAPEYFFADGYYEGLRAALGDRLHLLIVESEGAIAATILFVETCGIVEYHLLGVDVDHMRKTPAALALHEASSWAADRGDAWLHLGGGVGAAEDSLLHFKTGFSPLRFPYRTLRLVVDEAEYARLSREHDPSWDGSPVGGFFPAYRRSSET